MSDLSLPPLTLLPLDEAPAGSTWCRSTPFVWPSPSIGAYPAPRAWREPVPCDLEGLNSSVMRVKLVSFDLDAGVALIQSPGLRAPLPLRFAQFKRLALSSPLKPQADLPPDAVQPYALKSNAGAAREGLTVSCYEEPEGVFVFEPTDAAGSIRRVFFPKHVYDYLTVGEKLQAAQRPAAPTTRPQTGIPVGESSHALPTIQLPPLDTPSGRTPAPAAEVPIPVGLSVELPDLDDLPAAAAATGIPPSPAQRAAELLLNKTVSSAEDLLAAIEQQARMPMVRMGEALVALGYVSQDQLDDALEIQRADRGTPLGEILVRQGRIKRQDLQMALVRKMGYPVVDLSQFEPTTEALAKLSYTVAARLQVLPLMLRPGRLFVAVEDPTRVKALDEVEFASGCKVVPALANPGALGAALDAHYQKMGADVLSGRPVQSEGENELLDASELLASLEQQGSDDGAGEDGPSIEQSDNSLVRLINQMILEAQAQGVSDIHIESQPGKEKVRIRFRRDGVLKPYMELPPTYRSALLARIKIMCDLDISERRKPQDGKIAFGKFHAGSRLDLRVATIPTAGGLEDAVLRLLASARPLPIDEIGLAPRNLKLLKEIVERPYGMFLCVGPTGSGKTTTLHSALGYINVPERKIWTAEDPVEITQPGLRQVQVNPKIDWTFARALRAFLRADPDVIMVGEIRDEETATTAVESSLTGHLVLSTLHTNSAPETVTRLLDMGMDPFNFADALLGVLAQRLVRRICGSCKTASDATPEQVDELLADYLNAFGHAEHRPSEDQVLAGWRQRFGTDGRLRHVHGAGCDKCGGSGLRGRAAIHELMFVSRDVRRIIQTGGRVDELQKAAMAEGMLTLRQDGIEKVLQGVTTIGEVRASSN